MSARTKASARVALSENSTREHDFLSGEPAATLPLSEVSISGSAEALASSTRGVIWEGHFRVNTPHERKMTFLSTPIASMCITGRRRTVFQGSCAFASVSPMIAWSCCWPCL